MRHRLRLARSNPKSKQTNLPCRESQEGIKSLNTYRDLDRDKRTPCEPSSAKLLLLALSVGLGGRDPEKKGCASRAKALVARLA